MSAYKDGGPAFPQSLVKDDEGNIHSGRDKHLRDCGMSLRDYLASKETLSDFDAEQMSDKIINALATEPKPEGSWSDNPLEWIRWEAGWRARLKYIRADAMIKAREDDK